MKIGAATVLCVAVLSVSSAQAEPIAVTSGSIRWSFTGGSAELIGENFIYTAGMGAPQGLFGPWRTSLPCAPGTIIDTSGFFGGPGLGGDRLNGVDVPFDAPTELRFSGGIAVAPFSDALTATIVTSRASARGFVGLRPGVPPLFEFFTVHPGTLTLTLSRSSVDQPWSYRSAVYDFNAADPVPEPATVVLLGSGLAALWYRRQKFTDRA